MPVYTALTAGGLLVRLAERRNALVYSGTATAGAAGTLTDMTIPSALADDPAYENRWLYTIAGTSAGDERAVTDYNGSGVLTANRNFTATPDTTTQYMVTTERPLRLLRALQDAQDWLANHWVDCNKVIGREVVIGSALPNNFDLFTTANVLDGLTLDSNSTFTSQTTPTLGGRRVLRMVTDGTNAGFVRYSVPAWGRFQGKTVNLYVHLRASIVASNRVGIQINDGVTTATEAFLTTINDWQRLYASQAMGAAATQLRLSIEATAGAAVTIEMAWWYAPEPFDGEYRAPLDADRNLIAIGHLRPSKGNVASDTPAAHLFDEYIPLSAYDLFEDVDDTPRQLRLYGLTDYKGRVLEYAGLTRTAELTGPTISYPGDRDLLLNVAMDILDNGRPTAASERLIAGKIPIGYKGVQAR